MNWRDILFAYLVLNAIGGAALLLFLKGSDGGEERERPIDLHKHAIDAEAGYDLCKTGECECRGVAA